MSSGLGNVLSEEQLWEMGTFSLEDTWMRNCHTECSSYQMPELGKVDEEFKKANKTILTIRITKQESMLSHGKVYFPALQQCPQLNFPSSIRYY